MGAVAGADASCWRALRFVPHLSMEMDIYSSTEAVVGRSRLPVIAEDDKLRFIYFPRWSVAATQRAIQLPPNCCSLRIKK